MVPGKPWKCAFKSVWSILNYYCSNATIHSPTHPKCNARTIVGHPNCLEVLSTTMTCLIPSELHQPSSKLPPWLTRLACHTSEKEKKQEPKKKQNKQPAFIRLTMYVCIYNVCMYVCLHVMTYLQPNQTRSSDPNPKRVLRGETWHPNSSQLVQDMSREYCNGQSAGQTLYLQGSSSFAEHRTLLIAIPQTLPTHES